MMNQNLSVTRCVCVSKDFAHTLIIAEMIVCYLCSIYPWSSDYIFTLCPDSVCHVLEGYIANGIVNVVRSRSTPVNTSSTRPKLQLHITCSRTSSRFTIKGDVSTI